MSKSLAQELADLRAQVDEAIFEEELAAVADKDWQALQHDWGFWGRPEQHPPPGEWSTWLVLAGRGFGKTRTGAEAVRDIVRSGEVQHVALVAPTPADARDVMIEGPAGILAISPPDERPTWNPSLRRLTWPNGATATTFSGENPDQLRGPQHQLAWVDELCAYAYPQETWDNLEFGMRLSWVSGAAARSIITTTPRPIPTLRQIMSLPGCVQTNGSTFDNAGNLDESFLDKVRRVYEGTRLGRQELFAELLDDVDGALWTRAMLDGARGAEPPEARDIERVVVGVDPAASSKSTSDETGIVVVAKGVDGHCYVLADRSCRLSPEGWGRRVVEAATEFGADCIVAEVNNGGDMVSHVIRTQDTWARVKQVHASRGKRTRAEPVSSLYEQRRVKHCGYFVELENQLLGFTATGSGDKSPDRADAMVWAVTELMLGDEEIVIV